MGSEMCIRDRQLHRSLQVGEEDSDLLTFAFEGAPGGEDLLGEVLRGVGFRGSETSLTGRFPFDGCPTLIAESRSRWEASSAGRAGEVEASPAPQAELRVWRVLVLAPGTLHHEVPGPPRLALHRGGVKHGSPLRLRLLLSTLPVRAWLFELLGRHVVNALRARALIVSESIVGNRDRGNQVDRACVRISWRTSKTAS